MKGHLETKIPAARTTEMLPTTEEKADTTGASNLKELSLTYCHGIIETVEIFHRPLLNDQTGRDRCKLEYHWWHNRVSCESVTMASTKAETPAEHVNAGKDGEEADSRVCCDWACCG